MAGRPGANYREPYGSADRAHKTQIARGWAGREAASVRIRMIASAVLKRRPRRLVSSHRRISHRASHEPCASLP